MQNALAPQPGRSLYGLAENDRNEPGEQAFPYWRHPRETISWYQAMTFCRWLTEQATRPADTGNDENVGRTVSPTGLQRCWSD
ncbi:MAG: hypothetical protein KJZ86_19805 [Caldilineaceae bacterium]|nr:hypothetical protein [Caldilineaceae bacterium]HRJ44989.1 hypothetical protein [Caldilineaceae bacterium]